MAERIPHEQCAPNHTWVANTGRGGEPDYRAYFPGGKLTMHVMCERCGTRTWFTEEQWKALPEAPPQCDPSATICMRCQGDQMRLCPLFKQSSSTGDAQR